MSDEHFTGVRPSFEVVIYGEVVDRTSTKREAELALREALELHHYPEYPPENEYDSGDSKEFLRGNS